MFKKTKLENFSDKCALLLIFQDISPSHPVNLIIRTFEEYVE